MAKYRLTQKLHEGATKATLGGREYAVKEGVVEFPDDRDSAHAHARIIGAEPVHGDDKKPAA